MLGLTAFAAVLVLSTATPLTRILGGYEIDITVAPYNAALEYQGRQICGGAIISNKFILTAGHCLTESDEGLLKIRVGSTKRESGGQLLTVKRIYEHPQHANVDYDVGLVELNEPLTFDISVQAISLPTVDDEIPVGKDAVVTGWGYLQEPSLGGKPSDVLKAATVPIASRTACKAVYPGRISERMFCAGGPLGNIGPCNGDSGAPLVYNSKLVGIYNWGNGCARPNYPGVYQDVSKYLDFISSHLSEQFE